MEEPPEEDGGGMELKPDVSVTIASRQTAIRPKVWIVLILLSILLVAFGHTWFIQINASVPSGNPLQPTSDNRNYQAIYNGEYDKVILGQRYRVLMPLLARLLPGSFFDAARVISYVSLAVFYAAMMWLSMAIGQSLRVSFFSVLLIYSSTIHQYNYWNPYETDCLSLGIGALLLAALVTRRPIMFAVALALGVLGRETNILFAPLAFLMGIPAGLLSSLAALAAYVGPRLVIPHDSEGTIAYVIRNAILVNRERSVASFLRQLIVSWGPMWLMLLLGLRCVRDSKLRRQIEWFTLYLLAICFATSVYAYDVVRMQNPLTYVVFLAAVFWLQETESRWRWSVVACLVIARLALYRPNLLWPSVESRALVKQIEMLVEALILVGLTISTRGFTRHSLAARNGVPTTR
jgi:hypothetical protein